ncbi:MAG TPA: glycosyl transferase family protein [Bryobacteraceae bacterium]|nr:glycosyl transferase family protein [Bryobacteraceae bacterium]
MKPRRGKFARRGETIPYAPPLKSPVGKDFSAWLSGLDPLVAQCLFPAAIVILVSGLDDLLLDAVYAWVWLKSRFGSCPGQATSQQPESQQKSIAIFVPLWQEHAVIGGMVEHNIAAIRYENYHFFLGGYPNDEPTLDAIRELELRFPRVHLAVCPHDGPTSKADCLNWIYQRMLLFEETHDALFEIVVTHDAEDLIHADALARINTYSREYDMVQVPVMPLATPFPSVVHSIYCDEFAEWQLKDMPARQFMRSFLPSNGVGTGYTREALEKLAAAEHNLIFEPASLTEDYENGLRLHRLGCKQVFVPLSGSGWKVFATREFFPKTVRSAIRQRTRWITGIGLQAWQHHGWRGPAADVYWFWRDRKGLIGNPMSLFTNLLFAYGMVSYFGARFAGTSWPLARHVLHPWLLACTLAIQLIQTGVRCGCAWRMYGLFFAVGVPIRNVCANWINSIAAVRAVYRYSRARLLGEPLAWLKTEHAYPSRAALVDHKRRLGEILAGSGYASESDVAHALETLPIGVRLGEHLVQLGKLTEDELYEALSAQQAVPAGRIEPWTISRNVARALPLRVVRAWQVLPFRIAAGHLYLASPEIPSDELTRALQPFTRLVLRFQLITPGNFAELSQQFL